MKRLIIVSLLSLVFLFGACDKENIPSVDKLSPETKELIDSDNEFGFDLLNKVNSLAEANENICVSPLSVSLALAMTSNGAVGDTQISILETLRLAGYSRDDMNLIFRDLVLALTSDDPKVKLDIANSIWYRNDFEILDDFVERNEVYYDASVEALDFSKPDAKDVINSWVSDNTNKKIESIVDQISAESFMFLINAIYFKGTWKYEFDEKDTRELEFFKEDGTIKEVPTMKIEADLNLMRNELFSAVELPYGKGNWAMYVLLPNGAHKVQEVISELDNENWKNYRELFQESKELKLQLPKWKSEFETSLAEVLKGMGMGIAFTNSADFSDILPGAPLQISDVKHKTFIEVNEEGTEAAAVTSVEIELTSVHGEYFIVNKPFVYLIAEKTTGSILFAGKVMDPSI